MTEWFEKNIDYGKHLDIPFISRFKLEGKKATNQKLKWISLKMPVACKGLQATDLLHPERS
jgi:hypothetical protein